MPVVTNQPRLNNNGDAVTHFVDTAGTTSTTWTYSATQNYLKVMNNGIAAITVTVGSITQVINPSKTWEVYTSFTTVAIQSSSGVQEVSVFAVVLSNIDTYRQTTEQRITILTGGASAPDAVTGLTVFTRKNQAFLTWLPSTKATSYTVKRGTASGGPYSTVFAGVTAPIYRDIGLTSGTTYYYVVTASNATGESAASTQAVAAMDDSAIPVTPPSGGVNTLPFPSSPPLTETFDSNLSKWSTTSGIAITSGSINLASGGTTHTNVALFNDIPDARGIEVTLAAGQTSPGAARIAFGSDLNSWEFYSINSASLYPVINGTLGTQKTGPIGNLTIASGDTIKTVIQGQNVQVWQNGVFKGTLIPGVALLPAGPLKAGLAWRSNSIADNVLFTSIKVYPKNIQKYTHLSFDDVIGWLHEITTTNYASLWLHPAFAWMKNLHDTYGAVFSLYLFFSDMAGFDLTQVTNKYSAEFAAASSWLRLGFHAYDNSQDYMTTPANAATHHNQAITEITRFASASNIDKMPRIHTYRAALSAVQAWKATGNFVGMLTPDDTRAGYTYLNGIEEQTMRMCDDYYETAQGLYFIRTDFRCETTTDMQAALDGTLTDYVNYGGHTNINVVFTHEGQWATQAIKDKMVLAIQWAVAHGHTFHFPMDNIQQI